MAFTQITITLSEERPDGHPAQGTVTATLSERIVNSGQAIDPTPISGVLNAAGQLKDTSGLLPFQLEANDDQGTLPQGSYYLFVIELDSAQIDPFQAVIPHAAAAGTVDLSTLMPAIGP